MLYRPSLFSCGSCARFSAQSFSNFVSWLLAIEKPMDDLVQTEHAQISGFGKNKTVRSGVVRVEQSSQEAMRV